MDEIADDHADGPTSAAIANASWWRLGQCIGFIVALPIIAERAG